MSTLQENLDRIKNAKSAIKNAIIQKGIDVTDTEKIETYADKILQIKSGGGTTEIPEFDPDGPLTIYCFDDWGDAYVQFDNGYQESTIQYSTDGSTWKTYTDETIKLTKGQYVQFKGVITQYAQSNHFSTFILKNGLFNLYGNLTSLDNYISTFNGGYKYNHMFENTNVYDCSKLNTGIKSQTGSNVFEYMFSNCLNLIKAPELPSTTLGQNCYQYMFSGCTSLTTLPSNLLPATTLAEYCYQYMFNGCSSLTTLDLSGLNTSNVTTMQEMFSGCTSLTSLNLSDLNMKKLQYVAHMFYDCSSLTDVFINQEVTLNRLTNNLSKGDISYIPKTATIHYNGVDYKWNKKWTISEINVHVLYGEAVDESKALPTITLNDKVNTPNLYTPFNIFHLETWSDAAPTSILINNKSNIKSLNKMQLDTSNITDMSNLFNGCSSLTTLDLSKWNISNVTNMQNMFFGCSSLKDVYVTSEATLKKLTNNLTSQGGNYIPSNNGNCTIHYKDYYYYWVGSSWTILVIEA